MVSRTRHRIRYRCGIKKCRTRFARNKRAKRDPQCPACGNTLNIYNIEQERRNEFARQTTCRCDAYPFPHQLGTMTMCIGHPDRVANIEPTDEEILNYQSCLNTPRSG